jgi:Na+-translocating ferredoxin:NAD+ oxidoreductase RnfD subunit
MSNKSLFTKKEEKQQIIQGQNRKWKLVLGSLALIVLGYLITSIVPALSPIYTVYVSAIIAINGVYGGANVASKWVQKSKKDDTDNG